MSETTQDTEREDDEVVDNTPPRPYDGAYQESEDHVPNPYFQYAQVDTTGTGAAASSIQDISPAFAEHRAAALSVAVEELTNQTDDSNAHVVLPDSDGDHEAALANVENAQAETQPVTPEGTQADDSAPAVGSDAGSNPVDAEPNVGAEQTDGSVTPGPQEAAKSSARNKGDKKA